jgi:hypothetical protein
VSNVPEKVAVVGKLLANKGIPPFLLAANIAEANYESVRLWKEDGTVRVETVCVDEETSQRQVYLYLYDAYMVLQSIQQTVGSNHAVIWNRQHEIAAKVKEAFAEKLGSQASSSATVPDQDGLHFPRSLHA